MGYKMCDCQKQKQPSISVQVDNATVNISPSLVVDTALEAIARPLGGAKKFLGDILEAARP